MKSYISFILAGYLCGSILFAWILPRIFWGVDTREKGSDHNPGTANAFLLCGSACGSLVLLLELGKGFLPVFLAGKCLHPKSRAEELLFALAAAAPVAGHAWPVFSLGKKGGKGIAVSFGVFLGLFMEPGPLRLLVFFYLLFSLAVQVNPHGLRTVLTYACVMAGVWFAAHWHPAILAACLTGGIVILRNLRSALEEKPQICVLPMIERRYFRKVKEEQEDRKL